MAPDSYLLLVPAQLDLALFELFGKPVVERLGNKCQFVSLVGRLKKIQK